MAYHAKLSPSGAIRWAVCTAAPGAEVGQPDNAQDITYWGTAAHLVGSTSLETGKDPAAWHGSMVRFLRAPDGSTFEVLGDEWPKGWPEVSSTQERFIEIDDEVVACATTYVNFVRDLVAATGGELLVEQKLPIGQVTGEAGATGTGDTCVLDAAARTIHVVDLKGGMGYVSAYESATRIAETHPDLPPLPDGVPNFQLGMYGLGALEAYGLFGEWDLVRLVIVQPRLNSISEYVITVEALRAFGEWIKVQAEEVRTTPTFRPGADQCHFCRAMPTCKALHAHVLSDMPDLASLEKPKRGKRIAIPQTVDMTALLLKKPLIEMLLEAVEDRVRSDLEAGRPVPNVKLVEGRKAARTWASPALAEKHLTYVLGDAAFTKSLISPTEAEKVVTDLGAWEHLTTLIDESKRTKPVIVAESDPRPSITTGDMPVDETNLFD